MHTLGHLAQEVIDRVTVLEKQGRLTGVIDDRGKFIFVTRDEMNKVRTVA